MLIEKDLVQIKAFKLHGKGGWKPAPPGYFSKELARYANVLMNIKRTTEKLEDQQRAWLKSLTTKELRELANAKEAQVLSNKKLPKPKP